MLSHPRYTNQTNAAAPPDLISQLSILHGWLTNPAQYDKLIADLDAKKKEADDYVEKQFAIYESTKLEIESARKAHIEELASLKAASKKAADEMLAIAKEKAHALLKEATARGAQINQEAQAKADEVVASAQAKKVAADDYAEKQTIEIDLLKKSANQYYEKAKRTLEAVSTVEEA